LAWGFFSVALVYWVHKPFERFVLAIPANVLSPVTHIVLAFAAADFALSFKTAIELRDVLVKLEKAKEELRLMQRRLEVIEAVLADEREQKKEERQQQWEQKAEAYQQQKEQKAEARQQQREQMVEQAKELVLGHSEQAVEQMRERTEQMRELTSEKRQQLAEEMAELRSRMAETTARSRDMRGFTRDKLSLLRRNPSAVSKHYAQAFEAFRGETWPELKEEIKAGMRERKEREK
jgi:septal ring factor EnvC (AmiA/AmiB activator)